MGPAVTLLLESPLRGLTYVLHVPTASVESNARNSGRCGVDEQVWRQNLSARSTRRSLCLSTLFGAPTAVSRCLRGARTDGSRTSLLARRPSCTAFSLRPETPTTTFTFWSALRRA